MANIIAYLFFGLFALGGVGFAGLYYISRPITSKNLNRINHTALNQENRAPNTTTFWQLVITTRG